MDTKNKVRENRIRRAAERAGLMIRKSRAMVNSENFGGYMLVNLSGNFVVSGDKFDMSLDDLEEYFEIKPNVKQ